MQYCVIFLKKKSEQHYILCQVFQNPRYSMLINSILALGGGAYDAIP
ncbi:hypothetical protein BTH160X_300018 [Brochothrix thermosphacta]|nr:hypothetical protein BTH160X_300018 [Brochothrix thermosphacta]